MTSVFATVLVQGLSVVAGDPKPVDVEPLAGHVVAWLASERDARADAAFVSAAQQSSAVADVQRAYRTLVERRGDCSRLPEPVHESCFLTAAHGFAWDLRDVLGEIETFGPGGLDSTVSATRPVTRDILDGRVFSRVGNHKRGIMGSTFVVFGWNGSQHEAIVAGISHHRLQARVVVDGTPWQLTDLAEIDGVWLHHNAEGEVVATELAPNIFYATIAPGDWDRDGKRDSADLIAFFGSFQRGAPRADLDGDGELDADDVRAFLDLWE